MSTVKIDFSKEVGKIKVMHAVNNGPNVAGTDQKRGNEKYYQMARIPYARNHDAAFFSGYGGEHSVDINAIFPNFDADVNDESSYDFACTDRYVEQVYSVGTKMFYRLGSKIEHGVKKYGTHVPKDFKKWAQICEHIIRHYTEGWANGFNYDMKYWEIWNEPDLDPDDSKNKRCWQGTEAQFAELYCVASKHLKECFPHLKIGGPASAGDEAWMVRFLERISKENAPLDFFSYHWYWTQPYDMSAKITRVRKIVDDAGYKNAETILNEWNYVRGWVDEFVYSIEQMVGMKGAAFMAACMTAGQKNPGIDMLMYYDARPCAMNGIFDMYTYRPLKGYFTIYSYANIYELGTEAYSECDDEDVYVIPATDGSKKSIMLTYYAEDDNKDAKLVTVDAKDVDLTKARIFITDRNRSFEISPYEKSCDGKISLWLERNSVVYIEI